jgi:hypothetical protein
MKSALLPGAAALAILLYAATDLAEFDCGADLDHQFVLATTDENLKHVDSMKKNPDIETTIPTQRNCLQEDRGDRLEVHQGRRVRIFLAVTLSPRSSTDRHRRHQIVLPPH